MKPYRLAALAAAVCAFDGAANAEPNVAQYEQLTGDKGTAETKLVLPTWLAGVATGLQWMNTDAVRRGQANAFCTPETFGASAAEFDTLMRSYLAKRRAALDAERQKDLAEFPVGLVMLNALKDAFPCKAAAATPGKG
jgi:hypothetical protein